MVFNNSRVRKSRIYGTTNDGAEVEFLLLFPEPNADPAEFGLRWRAMASKAKRQKLHKEYLFPQRIKGHITKIFPEGLRTIEFETPVTDSYLNTHGHIPLPPYISREDTKEDASRYQTVYSKEIGSAAAPTAGLHFTEQLLASLDEAGVIRTEVTLHVGLGTFLPVRVENILEHTMHSEDYSITPTTAEIITRGKLEGRPIVAVGTTAVRTLESAWNSDEKCIVRGKRATDIFIYPGYQFKVVDQLFTNFHTPRSSLVMLVSAFASREMILNAYEIGVENRYRFFSYGDAMLIR